ncbi:MAG TPA: ATP-binding protein [Polyangia bacterium]|nr:ATP-binding protein [Polyangia bacterium]
MGDLETTADALRQAEAALGALPIAVAQFSAATRYLWVSQRYAEWLGPPRDKIVGQTIAEVMGPACMQGMRPHIEAALAGKAMQRDAEVVHKRLGRRWIHVDCVPTFGPSGAPDGWIEAITDVTEQKRVQESLRENRSALQSFYDSSPFFMGLVELDGDALTFLSANQALAEVLGTTAERMANTRANEFATEEEARLWLESCQRSGREGVPVRIEYQHPTPSGQRWYRATVAFIGENPRPRFSLLIEEITEQRKAAEALQEGNRSKDEFLAMLGHELRNPLSPIVTALQLLKLRSDGQYGKALEIVERQVQYLIRLVNDLLDVSRITRGTIQIKKRLLRLRDVVAQGAEIAMPLIEQRRHHLDVRLPPTELRLNGDEGRLAQVVSNLLTNAAKYTDPGGCITIEARRRGSEIVLTVKDNGIGISADLLPHVFDMFTQERQAADRSRGGLGIGLTIVRNLVELHGGTVEARSEGPGEGSVFTVRLPLATEEPAAVESSSLADPVARARRRVLVVDDNEDALELLAEVLRDAGHVVATAKDGPTALKVMKTFQADVAILDIGLPVMDGYELAGRLRAELGKELPRLIALTGYGQESDRARAKQAGFAVHLTKPVEGGRLLGALDASPPADTAALGA